ncbi:MAG: pyridoxal phosphate-dependent aminotransferase [Desulfatibacillaceae bacterium]
MIHVKPHIAAMPRYQPPWSDVDRSRYLRLDLNENTTQPPDHVEQALVEYVKTRRFSMYPEYGRFLEALAGYAGQPVERLMVTNGSDQAIELLLRAFLGPGDTMLVAQPEFPIFSQVAGVIGAKVRGVPFTKDMAFPYEEFFAATKERPDLVVIINPNNPTGTPVDMEAIERVARENPDTPVVVDEAYFEYTGATAAHLLDTHDNVIVTRTFSKAFAMAGLRLGYLMARPEVIAELSKIRGPFDVNSPAMVAARAQIEQPLDWQSYVRECMDNSWPFLIRFFEELGVEYFPGSAHFLLVRPKNRDKAVEYLREHGVLVRPMFAPLIADTFRMCLGTLAQTRHFASVYEKFHADFDK